MRLVGPACGLGPGEVGRDTCPMYFGGHSRLRCRCLVYWGDNLDLDVGPPLEVPSEANGVGIWSSWAGGISTVTEAPHPSPQVCVVASGGCKVRVVGVRKYLQSITIPLPPNK